MLVSPAVLLAILLFSFSQALQAESPQLDPLTLQKIAQRSVNIHKSWGPSMNSPGASVEIKEIYRRPGAGLRFCLTSSGQGDRVRYRARNIVRSNRHDRLGAGLHAQPAVPALPLC